MFAYHSMLTPPEKRLVIGFSDDALMQTVLIFYVVLGLLLMIPVFIVFIVMLTVLRARSDRSLRRARAGDVLSSDKSGTTYIVILPMLLLLEWSDVGIGNCFILCHNVRDMARWIPSSKGAVRVLRRIGRVELVQAIKDASRITAEHDESSSHWVESIRWSIATYMWTQQVVFTLERHVRYIQRAWRKRRAQRRSRAAKVIAAAVLDYIYRPGGRRYVSALHRFDMSF